MIADVELPEGKCWGMRLGRYLQVGPSNWCLSLQWTILSGSTHSCPFLFEISTWKNPSKHVGSMIFIYLSILKQVWFKFWGRWRPINPTEKKDVRNNLVYSGVSPFFTRLIICHLLPTRRHFVGVWWFRTCFTFPKTMDDQPNPIGILFGLLDAFESSSLRTKVMFVMID